jgi:hypothetical protein
MEQTNAVSIVQQMLTDEHAGCRDARHDGVKVTQKDTP